MNPSVRASAVEGAQLRLRLRHEDQLDPPELNLFVVYGRFEVEQLDRSTVMDKVRARPEFHLSADRDTRGPGVAGVIVVQSGVRGGAFATFQ